MRRVTNFSVFLGMILFLSSFLSCKVLQHSSKCELEDSVLDEYFRKLEIQMLNRRSRLQLPVYVDSLMDVNDVRGHFKSYLRANKVKLFREKPYAITETLDSFPCYLVSDSFVFKEFRGEVEYEYYKFSPIFIQDNFYVVLVYYNNVYEETLDIYHFKSSTKCDLRQWSSQGGYHKYLH